MVDVDLLQKYLHEGIVNVTFVKADGTERVMQATLQPSRLPVAPNSSRVQKSNSPATARVFDVDIQEWRSFRYDSVKEIKV